MGYTVLAEALRVAAGVARAAGDAARGVDLEAPVADIGAALPGTDVVGAAAELATAWGDQLAAWSREVTVHGGHLDDSAATYDAGEDVATSELHRAGGG